MVVNLDRNRTTVRRRSYPREEEEIVGVIINYNADTTKNISYIYIYIKSNLTFCIKTV